MSKQYHYVPKYYLKGFTEHGDDKFIWTYQKGKEPFRTGINNIAKQNKFYSDDVESYLSTKIENPANPVLDKIRKKNFPNIEEKYILSCYIGAMIKRVPKRRKKIDDMNPEIVDHIFSKRERLFSIAEKLHPDKKDIIVSRRKELDHIYQKWSQGELPKDLRQAIYDPRVNLDILIDLLFSMTWVFYIIETDSKLITSDNPVFFFDYYGLGRPESEVSFPISTNVFLWATWRRDIKEGFIYPNKQLVKEINRRTATAALKYIYYHEESEWVRIFFNKSRVESKLSRIIPP